MAKGAVLLSASTKLEDRLRPLPHRLWLGLGGPRQALDSPWRPTSRLSNLSLLLLDKIACRLIAVETARVLQRDTPVRGTAAIREDDVEQNGASILRILLHARGHAEADTRTGSAALDHWSAASGQTYQGRAEGPPPTGRQRRAFTRQGSRECAGVGSCQPWRCSEDVRPKAPSLWEPCRAMVNDPLWQRRRVGQ